MDLAYCTSAPRQVQFATITATIAGRDVGTRIPAGHSTIQLGCDERYLTAVRRGKKVDSEEWEEPCPCSTQWIGQLQERCIESCASSMVSRRALSTGKRRNYRSSHSAGGSKVQGV
jgi:hypothetical protein